MIIFRYLSREVLFAMSAVSAVLLLIITSGRFVNYLTDAAAGKLDAEVLFAIMGYRIPGFLELILPLGLFIGYLLAYGRLYTDSEMVVLSACGISQKRLMSYSLLPAILVAVMVALLSLYVSPAGIAKAEVILNEQSKRTELVGLIAGRFEENRSGTNVTYAEHLSADGVVMNEVFMAGMGQGQVPREGSTKLAVIVAETGRQAIHPDSGKTYLKLENGVRYSGRPGEADYRVTEFDVYWQYLAEANQQRSRKVKAESRPTAELLQSDKPEDIAALHWRASLPVLVVIVTLLAVPLSKTNPRQGRYRQMIPAILLYFVYLVLLNAARGAVEDGDISPLATIWAVHGVFFLVSLAFFNWQSLMTVLRKSKHPGATHA